MCGIAGYLGPTTIEIEQLATRLGNALKHRGPDDEGQQVIPVRSRPDRTLLLVHRRLSILDLSWRGHQPMPDPGTGNWIVYNGEVYNFQALRCALHRQGIPFSSQTDTEVILKGYGFHGKEILSQLCGMFAFAVFDRRAEELLLAVDPLGIKPLYYYATPGDTFLFASELRGLLDTGIVPRCVDPVALEGYLSYGAVQAPNTIIAGVSTLLPGTYLRVRADGTTDGPHPYWSFPHPAADGNGQPTGRAAEELFELLESTVQQHLVSDAPLGVFLSGGIDSSSVVALAARQAPSLKTFSVTFREKNFSESAYSAEIARRYRTDHAEICLSEQRLLEIIPAALSALDQPSIDGMNVFVISQSVRDAGVKVILSGQGGDEIFAGYATFRRVAAAQNWRRWLPLTSRGYHLLGRVLLAVQGRHRLIPSKLGQYLLGDGDNFSSYFILRQLYPPILRRALFPNSGIGCSTWGLPQVLADSLKREAANLDPINLVSFLETRTYLANTLLRACDVMSMAHAIEVRVPFLDRRICEALAKLPGRIKLDRKLPKPLLLRAMNGMIPEKIWSRPKQGFTFPWEQWLRHHLLGMAHEALNDTQQFSKLGIQPSVVKKLWKAFLQNQPGVTFPRIWALVVLRDWAARNHISL